MMKVEEIKRVVQKKLPVGSEIGIRTTDMRGIRKKQERRSCILEYYPYHVLTINDLGLYESFSYFDVYNMLHGVALEERASE